ncbi:MAG: UPF0182 family protein [Actinomycetota bacterium]
MQRDTVVAVRELNIAGNPSRNWINDHLVYTHGFGFVAAYGNVRDADGKPSFVVGDLPPTKGLGKFEPRVYFGEDVPDYSIIGGGKSTAPVELDYPDDSSANGQKNVTYTGKGGVSNWFTLQPPCLCNQISRTANCSLEFNQQRFEDFI